MAIEAIMHGMRDSDNKTRSLGEVAHNGAVSPVRSESPRSPRKGGMCVGHEDVVLEDARGAEGMACLVTRKVSLLGSSSPAFTYTETTFTEASEGDFMLSDVIAGRTEPAYKMRGCGFS